MLGRAIGGGRARALAVACGTMLAFGGLAAEAHAQDPLEGVGKVVDSTLESVEKAPGEVEALLGGEQGPLSTASTVLCPPVSSIDELLQEHLGQTPVGAVGAGLTSLVCSAGLLEFEFHTRWVDPGGGTVTRTTRAVAGVPTALDVDNDPGPDLTGTITLAGGDDVALVVERAAGETAELPVSVEAVLTDTEARIIGRRHLAFGYDARADRAPDRFDLQTPLDTLLGPQGEYRFDLTQQGRGDTIALIGALFDGGVENRTNPTEIRLDYGASPDRASVRARVADGVSATLTTNRPGPAELSGRVVDGGAEDSAALEFEDLPSELTLGFDGDAGKVTYAASAPVDRLAARLDTAEATFLNARHFEATLLAVPQELEITAGRGASNFSLDASQAIGQIDLRARSANRAFPEVPAGEAGAVLDATGGEFGLALRVFGLRRIAASFDPVTLETDMEGGRVFTVDAKLDDGTEADVVLDKLPAQLSLAIDSATGKVTYAASDPMDRLAASVRSPDEIFLGARDVEATLLGVPTGFELTVGQDVGNLLLEASQPIGQIDVRARSANRAFPDIPAGQAGVVFDATGGELGAALRVFALRRLAASFDPVQVQTDMAAGRVFTIDAKLDQDGGAPLHATGVIDKLPAQFSLGIEDLPDPQGGSRMSLQGSDPIGFLRLAAQGLELLPGADAVELEINDIPTQVTVDLPEQGQLAALNANGHIGQIRLVASDGSGTLPGNSLGNSANDLFRFRDVPDDFQVAARLTGVRSLGVNLDPINLTLQQDPAKTRPVGIDAAFRSGDDPVTVTGLLNKPSASTSLSVALAEGQATRLIFDNAANVGRLQLSANGLGSVSSANVTLDNIPRHLAVCLDPGPGCRRGGGRPYPTEVSIDFEDNGTQTSGFTTLNANIALTAGDPVTITNMRFRELAMDFGQGSNFSCLGQTVPRMYLFLDSDSRPFVMNSVKFPPTVRDFQIGTDGNHANGNNRLVSLNGARTTFGVCTGLNTSASGSLHCGGEAELIVRLGFLGDVNILDVPVLGALIPVCSSGG